MKNYDLSSKSAFERVDEDIFKVKENLENVIDIFEYNCPVAEGNDTVIVGNSLDSSKMHVLYVVNNASTKHSDLMHKYVAEGLRVSAYYGDITAVAFLGGMS